MVLMNAGSRARNASSITNRHQGGGMKKAGLPEQIGRTSGESIAMHRTSQRMHVLRQPVSSTTRPSRPIGSLPMNFR